MKSIIPVAFALFSLQGIVSCKKADTELIAPPPSDPPPAVPVSSSTPTALKFMINSTDYLNLQFNYTELPGKVSVYIDDTLTTDPYDKLFASYSFNTDGYLTGNVLYNYNGDIVHDISVLRNNNDVSDILIKHPGNGNPVTDTFSVAFADSTAGYRTMHVDYGKYFDNIPVNISFTYLDKELTRSSAGLYTAGENSVFFPSFNYTYQASSNLINKWSDSYYGIDFFYEESGNGMDTLLNLLGGKDWQYLEAILNYDENKSMFFYPLYMKLAKGSMELDIYMHHFGPISQIRSVPSGDEYPAIEVFDFHNEFDDSTRVTKTTIFNNGNEYGSCQFSY